jgi:hypothetical protein
MPSDKSARMETHQPPDWKLPEIRAVEMRAAVYEPRRPRNFESPLSAARDAVEFVVRLAAPLPARALGPVLWVGEKRLTESESLDKEGKEFRFWSFDRTGLKEGAPISLLWMGEKPLKEKGKAKFTYRLAKR